MSSLNFIGRTMFTVVIFCLFPFAGFAETLSGVVVDPQRKNVPNARIRLFDRRGGELRSATSSSDGAFSFPGVNVGNYLLEADTPSGTLRASQEVAVSGDSKVELSLAIAGAKTDVLVTSSDAPMSAEEIGKSVDAIDSQEIEQRDEYSISDVLRSLPGVRVKTIEGPGSSTTIQIRGMRSQDTAVLLDGMRFRDPASPQGEASGFIEDLNIIDPGRVEVLRGSGSSLYGSHALGGVINISSPPGGGRTHGSFLAEGGGLGTIRSVATVAGGLGMDRFTYSAGVSHQNVTKGPRDGMPYRSTGTQGFARYSLTPRISLSGRIWYNNSYSAVSEDPAFTPAILANSPSTGDVKAIALPLDQVELYEKGLSFNAGNATYIPSQIDPDSRRIGKFYSGAFTLQHEISSDTSYRITFHSVSTRRTYLEGPAGPGLYDSFIPPVTQFSGYSNTLQAKLEQRMGRYNRLSVGYEFEGEKYVNYNGDQYTTTAASGFIKLRQHSNAVFFQDQVSLVDNKLQLNFAGRAQYFRLSTPEFSGLSSPYGSVTSLSVPDAYTADGAIAYYFRDSGTKIRGHVGNSFRAPSGYERFGEYFGSYSGDPKLSPERAVSMDAGIDQKLLHSRLTVSTTWFYTNRQQEIRSSLVFPSDPYGRFFGYINGGGGVSRGFEMSSHFSPTAKTSVGLSYTYVNADSRTPTIGANFYQLLDQPRHMFTATAVQWIGRRMNVSFDMSAYSNYTSMLFGGAGIRQFVFDGPVKADAVFHYDRPLSDRTTMEFFAKVENLLNRREYEDGYTGSKAWVVTGIRLRY